MQGAKDAALNDAQCIAFVGDAAVSVTNDLNLLLRSSTQLAEFPNLRLLSAGKAVGRAFELQRDTLSRTPTSARRRGGSRCGVGGDRRAVGKCPA